MCFLVCFFWRGGGEGVSVSSTVRCCHSVPILAYSVVEGGNVDGRRGGGRGGGEVIEEYRKATLQYYSKA